MTIYNSTRREPHPFKLFVDKDSSVLIVGSFPTTDNRISFDFFYPNATNKFWTILTKVFTSSQTKLNLKVSVKDKEDVKQQNKRDREAFCRENKIAITDIIESCIRVHDNSKDSQLLVHRYTDILKILKNNKSINRIVLTAKSLGSSANHHFYQYLTMNEIDFEFDGDEKLPKGKINVFGRDILIFSIASTSYRNSHTNEKELITLYKKALK